MDARPWLPAAAGASVWLGMLGAWAARATWELPPWSVLLAVGAATVGVLAHASGAIWRYSRPRARLPSPALAVPHALAWTAVSGAAVGLLCGSVYLGDVRPVALERCTEAGGAIRALLELTTDATTEQGPFGSRTRADAVATWLECGKPGEPDASVPGASVTARLPATITIPDPGERQPSSPVLRRGHVIAIEGRALPSSLWRARGLLLDARSVQSVGEPGRPHAAIAHARDGMWAAFTGRDPAAASLIAGLAVGDDSRQSEELELAMRSSGLSHLTAVSGGNISILLGVVLGAASLVGARLYPRVILGTAAVGAYVALVGIEPSVLRAAVMGTVSLVAVLRGGPRGGVGLLGATVALLLIIRPALAVSWGMALSVAATAGIVTIGPLLQRRLQRLAPAVPDAAIAAVSVTATAQIFTAPLLAAMSGSISLAGLWANLLAAPLVVPITVLGLAVVVAGLIWPDAAAVLAVVAEPFGSALGRLAFLAAEQPGADVRWPQGIAGAVLLIAALFLGLIAYGVGHRYTQRLCGDGARRGAAAWIPAAAGLAATLAVLTLVYRGVMPRPASFPANWSLVACDVGQGDAYLLRASPRSAVLIDTGRQPPDLLACIAKSGTAAIDLVLITHFDDDHVGAMAELLDAYPVGGVISTPVQEPQDVVARVSDTLQSKGLTLGTIGAGGRLRVGEVAFDVLWPRRVIRSGRSAENNGSLVLLAQVGGLRALLTGDIEPEAQRALMADEPPSPVHLATIPHHGSRHRAEGFARWAGPAVAVASAGRGNPHGHPHPDALGEFSAAGAVIARTDTDGSVVVLPDDVAGLRILRTGPESDDRSPGRR